MIRILRASEVSTDKILNRDIRAEEDVSRIVDEIIARVRAEGTPPCLTTRKNSTGRN